jgi:hypothetical protein
MSVTAVSTKLTHACIAKESEIAFIKRTIYLWDRFLKDHETAITTHKESSYLLYDYKIVLSIAEADIHRLGTSKTLCIILGKDSCGQIQSIGSFTRRSKPYFPSESFEISSILTAPWNILWPSLDKPPSIKGGGILIIYTIYKLALKTSQEQISLSSTASSVGFYQKLGMKKISYNRFILDIPKEHGFILACFAKAFLSEEGAKAPTIEEL